METEDTPAGFPEMLVTPIHKKVISKTQETIGQLPYYLYLGRTKLPWKKPPLVFIL